jgi:hypothetical protein
MTYIIVPVFTHCSTNVNLTYLLINCSVGHVPCGFG